VSHRYARVLCALAALSLPAANAAAQMLGTEPSYSLLRRGDADLTQIVLPVGVSVLAGPVRLDANTAFMRATLAEPGAPASELSGLTDITLRGLLPLAGDRVRVALSLNLPTGETTLAPDQFPVAAALNTDLYMLPVAALGSGFGVTTLLALAQPVGEWVVGASGAYRIGSAFEATPGGGEEFRPGDELRLRLALERPHRAGWAARLGASVSRLSSAELEADQVVYDFHPGNRIVVDGMVDFPVGSGSAMVHAWNLYRASAGDADNPIPAADVAALSRNLTGAGVRLSLPLGAALSLRPMADMVLQVTPGADAALETGDGFLVRAGTGVGYRIGRLVFEPAALAQFGRRGDHNLVGFILRGGLLW
jgi:hypothetical protein